MRDFGLRSTSPDEGSILGDLLVTERTVSGTTDTLVLADGGQSVSYTNATAVTVTVPPNSAVAFPIGTVIEILQAAAGKVTIAPGSGVTINAIGSVAVPATPLLGLRGQWAALTLRKRGTDLWHLQGDTA